MLQYPPPLTLEPYPPPSATVTLFPDWSPAPIDQSATVIPVSYTYSLDPQSEVNGIEITSFTAMPSGGDILTIVFLLFLIMALFYLLKWSLND